MRTEMKPLLDGARAHQQSAVACAALRAQRGGEGFELTLGWLEALVVQQQVYMTQCAPERLHDAQVRLKQLMALRAALAEPGGALTGYVFD